jgi:hypothetical protein
MLTCRELVQQEASDYIDQQLSWRRRVGVALHLLMCGNCRQFLRQFKQLSEIVRRQPPEPVDDAKVQLLANRLHYLHNHPGTREEKK